MDKIIILGIGGMLLFALGVVFFVVAHQRRVIRYQMNLQKLKEDQQKLLLSAAITSEEKERQRIAGDLHDEVGASLSAIRLYLLQITKKQREEPAAGAAKSMLDEVITTVRQISHRLSPETLMKFGLKDALQHLAQKHNVPGSFVITFSSSENVPRFSPDRELAVYRIVQEVLGNMVKHSGASEIALQLQYQSQRLVLTLEDNGSGFRQTDFERLASTAGGLGLKNIQSRVDILQAKINFGARPAEEAGTLMTLEVPLQGSDTATAYPAGSVA